MGLLCLALSATGAAAPPPARIDQMAWLAGQWREQGSSDRIDAFLLPPASGTMAGVFRRVRGGQVTTYALAVVEEAKGSLILRTRTFDSTLRGRQSQDTPSAQELVSISPNEIRFEKASTPSPGSISRRRRWSSTWAVNACRARSSQAPTTRPG